MACPAQLHKQQDGFALVLTLVFLSIFMVASLGVSFIGHIQTRATAYKEDKARAYFLAREGLVRAERQLSEFWAKRRQQYLPAEGSWISWSTSEGQGFYFIQNERGKLNLNTATARQISEVLSKAGVGSSQVQVIKDSILDWIDGDALHRSSGAEMEFYKPFSYGPRNAPLRHLGELALIRGIHAQLLWGNWGSDQKQNGPALWSFVTVYEEGRKIEVNSAPSAVLAALPGLSPAVAEKLIQSRRSSPLTRERLQMVLGETLFQQLESYLTTIPSRYYTIVSKASTKRDQSRHTLLAVVEVLPGGGAQHHYWLDDLWCGTTDGPRND